MMSKKKVVWCFLAGLLITVGLVWVFTRNEGQNESPPRSKSKPEKVVSENTLAGATNLLTKTDESKINMPPFASASDDTSCPTGVVQIAGTNIGVRFEVENISAELKQAILDDIELNTSHFKYFKFRKLNQNSQKRQIYKTKATHFFDEGQQKELFPKVFNKYFNGAVYTNGEYQLLVHEKLIEAYNEALAFKKENLVMFERLDRFFERLRDAEYVEGIAQDTDASKNLFLYDTEPSPGFDYSRQAQGLKNMEFRAPSILDFCSASIFGREDGVVCMTLLRWKQGDEYIQTDKIPPFIYTNGKWRIYAPNIP